MKNTSIHLTFLFILFVITTVHSQEKPDNSYGTNAIIGNYLKIDDTNIYYEEYGKGEPLLLIHGNSGSIKSMSNQIDYFRSKYRVIVADNRGHGKSELKTDSLTYSQIARDWESLVSHLQLDSLNIIGWSDGGIVGLKMAINQKSKIKKLIAMGANLRPDSTAVHSWAVNEVIRMKNKVQSKIEKQDTSQNWALKKQHLGLLVDQPTIALEELQKIKSKVLIIAGDEDIIKGEHTLEMYQNLRHAQLCIMPGETHFAPHTNPSVFNEIANRFLATPFKRPSSDWRKN